MILIKIDKKKVYELRIFEDEQERHRKEVSIKLRNSLEEIRTVLCETYESFIYQNKEI